MKGEHTWLEDGYINLGLTPEALKPGFLTGGAQPATKEAPQIAAAGS